MKCFSRYQKYGRYICQIEDAGGTNAGGGEAATSEGGVAAGGTSAATTDSQTNGISKSQNNAGNNGFDFGTMWSDSVDAQDSAATAEQPLQQQSAMPSPDEAFATHIKGLNLLEGFNAEQAMQSPEDLSKSMQAVVERTYKAAMLNANTLVSEQIDAVRTEMQQSTESTLQGQKVMESMFTALPFTQQPEFLPIAEGVLRRVLATGNVTPEKAIGYVKDYFSKLGGEITKLENPNSQALSGNRNAQGFPSGNAQASQGKQPDGFWDKFLAAKPIE